MPFLCSPGSESTNSTNLDPTTAVSTVEKNQGISGPCGSNPHCPKDNWLSDCEQYDLFTVIEDVTV